MKLINADTIHDASLGTIVVVGMHQGEACGWLQRYRLSHSGKFIHREGCLLCSVPMPTTSALLLSTGWLCYQRFSDTCSCCRLCCHSLCCCRLCCCRLRWCSRGCSSWGRCCLAATLSFCCLLALYPQWLVWHGLVQGQRHRLCCLQIHSLHTCHTSSSVTGSVRARHTRCSTKQHGMRHSLCD